MTAARCLVIAMIGCGAQPPQDQARTEPGSTDTRPLEPAWTPPPKPTASGSALAAASEHPERCSIRLTVKGITVDGDPMERARVVAVCKQRSAALVEISDEAREDWPRLRADLEAAGVRILIRGSRGHDEDGCRNNPLARGCF